MTPQAADLVRVLRAAGVTVAAAESLTGGLVAAAITDVPGASAVMRGGVVSYATDTKASVLGVDQQILDAGGPVQQAVAEQMADGVRRVLDADVGIATTGVAGPDPQGDAPVGRVFVAVATDDGISCQALDLVGDRAEIRAASVRAALELAVRAMTPRA